MEPIKQVIIIRNDLNMRKGKMVAQGAHASMLVFIEKMRRIFVNPIRSDFIAPLNPVEEWWITNDYRKVVCSVDSLDELLSLYEKAKNAGINVSLVKDNGLTEFKGVNTITAIAIGPDYDYNIDPITGNLKLL